MKTRKILALILAVLMAVGCLAACGGGSEQAATTTNGDGSGGGESTELVPFSDEFIAAWGETMKAEATDGKITLKVWGPEEAQDSFKKEVGRFSEMFKDYADISIEVAIQGEGDAASSVITDPEAAADVFAFADDQLLRLYNTENVAKNWFDKEVIAMNADNFADAASVDGTLYGYPETGGNSYFIAYDTRYVSADQAKTLEGLLQACKDANKKFIMDAGNGFFSCVYAFTGGLKAVGVNEDGGQQFNDYDIEKVTDSVEAFSKLFTSYSDIFESNKTGEVINGFKLNPTTVAAGVVGAWDIKAVKEALGDNVAFATLPTININGTDTPLVNAYGFKLLGVNSQSKYPTTSQLLAFYLSGEECQLERVIDLNWCPSNTNVINSDEVKNNAALTALLAQADNSCITSNLITSFWDPFGTLGKYIIDPAMDLSRDAIKAEVENCILTVEEG